ncbi:MAG: HMA2 domain-containing protein [Brasilonema sp.]
MTSRKRSNSNKHQQPKKTTSSVANKTAPSEEISYSVAHAIPGRIRFRIPRLVKDSEYANKLKQVIESDSRITNVRVNPTAASIVVSYQPGVISDNQMRSHLVNLIQTAPNIVLPPQVTTKSIMRAIFDALINLIDSTRNINQARNAIVYRRFRTDIWERLLSGTKTIIKRLKSATMFVLPNKRWRLSSPDGDATGTALRSA